MIQTVIQCAMFAAAFCYIIAAAAYIINNQPWMAGTVMCYVVAIFTIWKSGVN